MAVQANELKGLRKKRLTEEEKDKILSDFQETLLDFCESVIPNGARRGDEWDCAAGWRAMRRWNEDRTLPDGQVGAATGRKVAKGFRRLPHRSRGQV